MGWNGCPINFLIWRGMDLDPTLLPREDLYYPNMRLQIAEENNNQPDVCQWTVGWAFCLTLPYSPFNKISGCFSNRFVSYGTRQLS